MGRLVGTEKYEYQRTSDRWVNESSKLFFLENEVQTGLGAPIISEKKKKKLWNINKI